MSLLNSHQRIALDLDGTLIDGEISTHLQSYVINHPTKKFWIVTFRTRHQLDTLDAELHNVGLSRDNFQAIIPAPPKYALDFEEDQHHRRMAGLPPLEQAKNFLPGEIRWLHWKGYCCKRVGATILIDDMPTLVEMGCREYGVKYLNTTQISDVNLNTDQSTYRSAFG